MKTIFHFENKKITKKKAEEMIGKEKLRELIKKAKDGFFEDPYEEQSWYIGKGFLSIEFA